MLNRSGWPAYLHTYGAGYALCCMHARGFGVSKCTHIQRLSVPLFRCQMLPPQQTPKALKVGVACGVWLSRRSACGTHPATNLQQRKVPHCTSSLPSHTSSVTLLPTFRACINRPAVLPDTYDWCSWRTYDFLLYHLSEHNCPLILRETVSYDRKT